MSTAATLFMVFFLTLFWGGFVGLLVIALRRRTTADAPTGEDEAGEPPEA